MKKIFIITGEHSGDLHAAYVVQELKKLIPNVKIEGVGGKNLEVEGVKLFADHRNMGVVGFSFKALFDHVLLGKKIVDYLKNEYKPDLVLLIDYGGFNLRIAKYLRKNKIKTFYYISPQVWASRKGRLEKIRKYISKMMVIFPFEEQLYKSSGINTEYVGHPLVSQLPKDFTQEDFVKENGLDPYKKIVGIFPGSRKMELEYLLPIFLEAAKIIQTRSKKIQLCLGQAPNLSDELMNKYLIKYNSEDLDIKIIKNRNHALLACSDAVILASGTITLEAAIYKTPMVVSYKGPFWAYCIYLMLRYLSCVSLPNVIAQKEVVKEFLQYNANPDLIAHEILSLLHNEEKREKMLSELSLIREQLGDKIASQEVARILNDSLSGKEA